MKTMVKNRRGEDEKSKGCFKSFFSDILRDKLQLTKIILSIIIVLFSIIFSFNNDFLYEKPIGRVIKNESVKKYVKKISGVKSRVYVQKLTIKIRNTKYKDRILAINNKYTDAEFRTHSYNKGEKVFLEIKKSDDAALKSKTNQKKSALVNNRKALESDMCAKIVGVKRDGAFIFLAALTISLLIMIANRRSIFIILSTIGNVMLFLISTEWIFKEENIDLISILLSILIIFFTFILLQGFTRKSFSSIASTIVTVLFVIGLYELLVLGFSDLPYEFVQFTNGNEDIEALYRASLVFTILGAVMDVAVTVNSSVSEIIRTTEDITVKKLIPSIREIGDDINGTMINVVFFTFILGELPLIILKLSNGYAISTLLGYGTEFEIIRFLIGAIGIVLAIPVSAFFAIVFNRKELFR